MESNGTLFLANFHIAAKKKRASGIDTKAFFWKKEKKGPKSSREEGFFLKLPYLNNRF